MSNLKDIMDVDVEPLESQALRSREAAQQHGRSPPFPDPQLRTTSLHLEKPGENHEDWPTKRPRSNRSAHRTPESPTRDSMDYQTSFQVVTSTRATDSMSQASSMGSEHAASIKYTPITGRPSRAKKGVPVHMCNLCRPVKTFTRAEHLRRHQLSHQKPAYPCNFEDCERAFHRPDLLARHAQRHEPSKSGDSRSRNSSVASDGLSYPVKTDPSLRLSMGSIASTEDSPGESVTPQPLSTNEKQGSSNFEQLSGDFATACLTNSTNSHKRARSVALPETDTYNDLSPRIAPARRLDSRHYDMPALNGFSRSSHPQLEELYAEGANSDYRSDPTTPQLHLLRIPEEPPVIPGLSYTHDSSPWCSSASSSASTQSEGSRTARYWSRGADRTLSTALFSDWSVSMAPPQWSHTITATSQDVSGPSFEVTVDSYDGAFTASPQMILPGSRDTLNAPTSAGFYPVSLPAGAGMLSTYKPFVQRPPVSASQFVDSVVDIDTKMKPLVGSALFEDFGINRAFTYPSRTHDLDIYINSYFQHFHQFFPIIHRPTFDRNQDNLLLISMAAIGTQYSSTIEARVKGSELNELAGKEINLRVTWSTQVMQAILLTEIFTRFRGRRTNVRFSRHFEELYSRLLDGSIPHQTQLSHSQRDPDTRWVEWTDIEARQRLLASCFMFDAHQARYLEQPRSRARREDANNEPNLPCHESLWSASSSSEWEALVSNYSIQPLPVVEEDISSQDVRSPFTQMLLVCSFASRLPKRLDIACPNDFVPSAPDINIRNLNILFPASPLAHIYLALYHTPLYDLLAVSGDTWVFRRKITPASAFHDAQFRLKTWSSSLAAAQATHHACRILSFAMSVNREKSPFATSFEELTSGVLCIYDYWSLYVSALICWAFGNRYQAAASTIPQLDSSMALGATDMGGSSATYTPVYNSRSKALSYVNSILALNVEDLLTREASFRGDTAGVIDAVCRRLELENVGNRSGLLVDAIGVLKKIGIGGKNWF